jgi:hypothetical protein
VETDYENEWGRKGGHCRECSLLAEFMNPNGVIDDSEELLDEIPGWLEEIIHLRKQLAKVPRISA